ncbi:MAG TPA: hypothetical protein VG125_23490, partial [Pirellulales bacterium]|nr:hypothetical protein [Pirellulales bacterium]
MRQQPNFVEAGDELLVALLGSEPLFYNRQPLSIGLIRAGSIREEFCPVKCCQGVLPFSFALKKFRAVQGQFQIMRHLSLA